MTNEHIKQQAEAYADEMVANFHRYPVVEDFIAGAHSRDEEIEELKKKVSALETVIVTARATLSTQEAVIKGLRNPWNRIMHWVQMSELPKRGEK